MFLGLVIKLLAVLLLTVFVLCFKVSLLNSQQNFVGWDGQSEIKNEGGWFIVVLRQSGNGFDPSIFD